MPGHGGVGRGLWADMEPAGPVGEIHSMPPSRSWPCLRMSCISGEQSPNSAPIAGRDRQVLWDGLTDQDTKSAFMTVSVQQELVGFEATQLPWPELQASKAG